MAKSRRRGGPGRARFWPVLALLVLVGIAVWWGLHSRFAPPAPSEKEVSESQPAAPPTEIHLAPPGEFGAATGASEAPADAPGEWDPALFSPGHDPAESDRRVRELAAATTSNTQLSRWLEQSHLVNLFVVAVDQIASGKSPTRQLAFARPRGRFLVLGSEPSDEGPGWRIDPAGYRHYDALVRVVESLDPVACAEAYRLLLPAFQAAYEELGYPDKSFDTRFREAIAEILAAPEIEAQPELVAHVKRFEFADERLESLSGAQKQMLRMGPRAVRVLQAKVRAVVKEIRAAP